LEPRHGDAGVLSTAADASGKSRLQRWYKWVPQLQLHGSDVIGLFGRNVHFVVERGYVGCAGECGNEFRGVGGQQQRRSRWRRTWQVTQAS
jgi:hypothetical protein